MKSRLFIPILASVFSLALTSEAAVSQLTDRASVGANDSLDWSAAGAEFDLVPNPSTVNSTGGRSVQVSMPGGSFDGVRLDQGGGWNGGFDPADALFYTDIQDVWVDLTFATPIFAAAVELQPDFTIASDFTARIEAFDSSSTSLGFFDVFASINDPALLGVSSGSADIKRLRLSLVSLTDANPTDGNDPFPGFALNEVDFRVETVQGVPEGGGLGLALLATCATLLGVGRRYKNVSA